MKLISIVIPNWNGKSYLKNCIDSIQHQTINNFEIIIVDNGSIDGSVEYLEENYPEIRIIHFSENKGFSVAVNEGIRNSKGEYIVSLNNDTEVDHRWLEELIRALDRHPEVGSCASKMLHYYDKNIIDSAGDGYSKYGLAYKRGHRETDSPEYNKEEYVFGACAGASIYRKRLFEEVGLFDEDFFAYLEDADLNFRAQLQGYKCLYVPSAVVYHIIGGTSKRIEDSLTRTGLRFKNSLFTLIKNMPAKLFLKNLFFISIAYASEISLLAILGIRHPLTLFKIFYQIVKGLPIMLSKRKNIQERRIVSKDYISSLFGKGYFVRNFIMFFREKIGRCTNRR